MKEEPKLPVKLEKKKVMQLTARELDYQTRRAIGENADRAFVECFKGDPDWDDFFDSLQGLKPYEKRIKIRWAARKLDLRPEMKMLKEKVNERVMDLNPLALDTLEQIMIESKSDKVRADAAIEILRQNVGSPEKKEESHTNIKIVFGNDPAEGIVEGEVVDDRL